MYIIKEWPDMMHVCIICSGMSKHVEFFSENSLKWIQVSFLILIDPWDTGICRVDTNSKIKPIVHYFTYEALDACKEDVIGLLKTIHVAF